MAVASKILGITVCVKRGQARRARDGWRICRRLGACGREGSENG
jgi:hypothetical protein